MSVLIKVTNSSVEIFVAYMGDLRMLDKLNEHAIK